MGKRLKKKKAAPEIETSLRGRSDAAFCMGSVLRALVIAAVGVWIYWPSLQGGWLWDDVYLITDNQTIHSATGLGKVWCTLDGLGSYYPLTASVIWMQWHLWDKSVLGYHLTNVLLHVISSLLVWRLLSKFGLRLAWLGGLIFALHPLMVESVAWIAELKNTLSLPPLLLAMCVWIDYQEQGKRRDYLLALGLFLLAMLGKMSVVFFPVVTLLYAWWKRDRLGWKDFQATIPFFVCALILGLIMMGTGGWDRRFHPNSPDALAMAGFFPRAALVGLETAFYFSKVFLPIDLLPVYPKWAVDPSSPVEYLPWLVLVGVGWYLWTKRQGWGRHALLGLGFFLINLAPCPGFIPGPDMGYAWVMDHFLYVPIIGLIGLVVAGMGQVEELLPATMRPVAIGIMTVVLALLAWESHGYAGKFIDSETLWTYTLQRNPAAWPGYNNIGCALEASGRDTEAMVQFQQALRLNPDYAQAHYNLGLTLSRTGRYAEAMEQYGTALQLNPAYADARYNLGVALSKTGRLPEAIEQYERALQLDPDNAEAHNNLGSALGRMGQDAPAMEQFQQALQLDPDDAEAHNNMGSALGKAGRMSEAMDQFQQALKLNPKLISAHNNLANALVMTGRVPEGIAQYEETLKINPQDAKALKNLAAAQALEKTGAK